MGQATIFNGQKIKTLKDTLTLNGKSDIISSTVDPTASAVDAPIGSLLINQTSGKLYRKLDPGSSVNWEEVGAGVGGINYILNPSAEVNTTGWATYADAAGTAPVDGSGGSPNVTWTRSTTSPLRGVADFNFAKDAANRQGQGVSYDFTIDEADKAKVLSVTFDYEVLSGTYADGDLTVYLIADPAGTPVVIQPAGYTVLSATSGTTMRQRATFQTQATGTSYRLCFHVASTSASAYTLAIDNVVVGPQQTVQGAAITDWVSFTPTFNNISGFNISPNGVYRRVGDSIEVQVQFRKDASAGVSGSDVQLNLPFPMNTGKTAGGVKESTFGVWGGLHVPTFGQYNSGTIFRGDVSGTFVTFLKPAGASALLGTDFKAGAEFSLVFKYPAAGLSSNTVMSQDTDTRVVAASAYGGPATALAGNPVIFPSSTLDTHASYSTSTGRYTVPVSGRYRLSYSHNSTNTYLVTPYINAVNTGIVMGSVISGAGSGSVILDLQAGQIVDHRPSGSTGAFSGSGGNFSIERLSGPATIAASETVAAEYYNIGGQIIPQAAFTTVTTWTKSFDTHNFFNGSTGFATIPVSGTYEISLQFAYDTITTNPQIIIRKNSSSSLSMSFVQASWGAYTTIGPIPKKVRLNAGDTIDFRVYHNTAGTISVNVDARQVYMSIIRVGN